MVVPKPIVRTKAKATRAAGTSADLHGVVDTLPGLIWTALPDGQVDFLNRRWTEYTGLQVEAGVANGWQAPIHPDDLPALVAQWSAAIHAGTSCAAEVRLRRFDGVFRWFQFRASPLVDVSGKVTKWCAMNTDIEDCRRAEDPIEKSEQDMRHLIDRIPASITVANEKGEHIYTSSWGLTRSDTPPSVLRGLGFITQIHPDEQEWVKAEWLRCVATGQTMELDHRLKRADGVYRWLHVRVAPFRDEQGRIRRWYGLLSDIDEQRRAEEALRHSEQNFRLLVEMIPALVSRWKADGVLDYVNQRAIDYFGLPLAGIGPEVIHPDDWEARITKCLRSLKTGEPLESTHRLRRVDGKFRWFHERVEPMLDESGTVVCWYAVCIDINDSRELEEALHSTRGRLNVATQTAAIAQMSASIAHEINQPLSGIITNAGICLRMLGASPPDVDGAMKTARRTIRDGNRASEVIARLKDLFRGKRAEEHALVDLNDAAQEVIALSHGELQRTGAILEANFAGDLACVRGDRLQLQQVILNLLVNAAQAMEGVSDRPRRLQVITEPVAGEVRLTVLDAGTGLDPRHFDRIFDAFYTTKSAGMGIGLSVSRSIIDKHGGRIWAEASEGPGMTFRFSLPAALPADNVARSQGPVAP